MLVGWAVSQLLPARWRSLACGGGLTPLHRPLLGGWATAHREATLSCVLGLWFALMAMAQNRRKDDWCCKFCLDGSGQPYFNFGDRETCNKCGKGKGECHKGSYAQVVGKGKGKGRRNTSQNQEGKGKGKGKGRGKDSGASNGKGDKNKERGGIHKKLNGYECTEQEWKLLQGLEEKVPGMATHLQQVKKALETPAPTTNDNTLLTQLDAKIRRADEAMDKAIKRKKTLEKEIGELDSKMKKLATESVEATEEKRILLEKLANSASNGKVNIGKLINMQTREFDFEDAFPVKELDLLTVESRKTFQDSINEFTSGMDNALTGLQTRFENLKKVFSDHVEQAVKKRKLEQDVPSEQAKKEGGATAPAPAAATGGGNAAATAGGAANTGGAEGNRADEVEEVIDDKEEEADNEEIKTKLIDNAKQQLNKPTDTRVRDGSSG